MVASAWSHPGHTLLLREWHHSGGGCRSLLGCLIGVYCLLQSFRPGLRDIAPVRPVLGACVFEKKLMQ